MMNNEILVFLGPTLDPADAKQILPDAIYLPPIKCGDLLQVLRLQPKAIVIIDGFFENTASVWHKEILLALHNKIPVYGCSSMGAMRAAELADYGMQGYGEVFEYYKNNFISDDDEVAVLHLNEDSHYLAVTEAMVSIRRNCEKALNEGIISKLLFDTVIAVAKNSFYHQRTINNLYQQCMQAYENQLDVEKFFSWYKTDRIDLKKVDAIALLTHLKMNGINFKPTNFSFNQTSFLVCLYNTVTTTPFYYYFSQLPQYEKIVMSARLLADIYNLNKYFAKFLPPLVCLLSTTGSISVTKDIYSLPKIPDEIPNNLKNAYQQISSRIASVFNLNLFDEQHDAAEYFYDFLRIAFQYVNLKQKAEQTNYKTIIDYLRNTDIKKFNMLAYVALAWHYLDNYLKQINFIPTVTAINNYIQTFRIAHKLIQLSDFENWLTINDLTKEQYVEFVKKIVRYDHVIKGSNFEIFNTSPTINIDHYWLLFALIISGTYDDVSNLLADEDKLQQQYVILKNKALTNPIYIPDIEELEKFIRQIHLDVKVS